jgi:hypothetical protein
MLKPASGGLRPLVQNRRESVRVEFRVPPGAVVAVEDDAADDLLASGDFVELADEVAPVAGEEPVPVKRGPGRPRKG